MKLLYWLNNLIILISFLGYSVCCSRSLHPRMLKNSFAFIYWERKSFKIFRNRRNCLRQVINYQFIFKNRSHIKIVFKFYQCQWPICYERLGTTVQHQRQDPHARWSIGCFHKSHWFVTGTSSPWRHSQQTILNGYWKWCCKNFKCWTWRHWT